MAGTWDLLFPLWGSPSQLPHGREGSRSKCSTSDCIEPAKGALESAGSRAGPRLCCTGRCSYFAPVTFGARAVSQRAAHPWNPEPKRRWSKSQPRAKGSRGGSPAQRAPAPQQPHQHKGVQRRAETPWTNITLKGYIGLMGHPLCSKHTMGSEP